MNWASIAAFSGDVQKILRERSAGICEVCGVAPAHQNHHRRPRGMGGSKLAWVGQAANGLAVCFDCHTRIESNRAAAIRRGWLIPKEGIKTAMEMEVLYRKRRVFLDNAGGIEEVE